MSASIILQYSSMSITLLRSNTFSRTRASINQFGEGALSWGANPHAPPGAEGMASRRSAPGCTLAA
eukprot:6894211-Prymnesium_polylepis.2